jgi:3-deoxy-D-manno-octulosonic-acid transferase
MAELLCQRGGAIRVTTADELEMLLASWFADETSRKLIGNAALTVSREVQSTIHKTVDMILEHLDSDELYVAPEQQPAAV